MSRIPTSRLQSALKKARARLGAKPHVIPPATRSPNATQPPVQLPRAISRALKKASVAIARVRATEGALLSVIALFAGLLATCFVDWLVLTPQPVRIFLFLVQMSAVAGILRFRIIRPLSNKPSDRESALLLQKKFPKLRSAPISAIELACGHGRSLVGAEVLTQRLGAETAALLSQIKPANVASPNAIKRLLKIAGLTVFLNVVWIAMLWPDSQAWLGRWPGLRVPPPTQTIVGDVTEDLTAQRGTNVELRARAAGIIPRAGRVRLEFSDGTASEIPALPASGEVGNQEFSALVTSVQTPFRYSFRLNDGEGSPHRVHVVQPPTVEKFSIRETFPDYTNLKPKDHDTGSLNFLVGSTVEVKVTATQDLQRATSTLAGTGQDIPLEIVKGSLRAASGTIKVPADLTGISFPLVNTDGIASVGDTVFRATSTEDKLPILKLLGDAPQGQSLTPEASVDLLYSCTDDFGVSRVDLRYALADVGAAAAPAEGDFKALPVPVPEQAQATFSWKPGSLPEAAAGKVVFFFLEAADNRVPIGSGVVRTETRSLTLVTPAAKRLETIRRAGEASKQIRELGDKQLEVHEQLLENPSKQTPTP
ncbi:MAG: hypothetical protein WCS65_09765 [Verrucomicrobiae bacterium]